MISVSNRQKFQEEFARRGVWTQSQALRWYVGFCQGRKGSSKELRRSHQACTYHIKLMREVGICLGRFPVGKQGRDVNVWVHNSRGPEAIVGFTGDL